jgi:hypothetical protein
MWNFKTDIEPRVRRLDRYVNNLFLAVMLAAGFVKRGRTWKPWRDLTPKPAMPNVEDALVNSIKAAFAQACSAHIKLDGLQREAFAQAKLDATPEWWPELMKDAEGIQSDLINFMGRSFPHNDLEMNFLNTAKQKRQELGAVTRLEKILVEYMIVAWLYDAERTNVDPQAARRRIKRAAQMLETARRLLGSKADGVRVAYDVEAQKVADDVHEAAQKCLREADAVRATGVRALGESTQNSASAGAGPPGPPGVWQHSEILTLSIPTVGERGGEVGADLRAPVDVQEEVPL